MLRERDAKPVSGGLMLVVTILALIGLMVWLIVSARAGHGPSILTSAILVTLVCIGLPGFFVVNPNEAKVVTLFGSYVGSARQPGLWWTNPFTVRKSVSMRIRNFESTRLKVKDQTLKSRLHRGRLLLRERLQTFASGLSLHPATA